MKEYYLIGELSKITDIPIRTLHYYDEIGLFSPAKIDSETNYRYYAHQQIADINAIKYFKHAGFSLADIKELLKRDDMELNYQKLQEKQQEIDQKIKELLITKNRLNFYLNKENYMMEEEIMIREIPISYVAYSREKGSLKQEEFLLKYSKLLKKIKENELIITGPMMAIYHEEPSRYNKFQADVEVCVTVDSAKEIEGLVHQFGGFLAVTSYHYGSYSTFIETYKKVSKWAINHGYAIIKKPVEVYLIDLTTTVKEEEYITEVIIPVIKLEENT